MECLRIPLLLHLLLKLPVTNLDTPPLAVLNLTIVSPPPLLGQVINLLGVLLFTFEPDSVGSG